MGSADSGSHGLVTEMLLVLLEKSGPQGTLILIRSKKKSFLAQEKENYHLGISASLQL